MCTRERERDAQRLFLAETACLLFALWRFQRGMSRREPRAKSRESPTANRIPWLLFNSGISPRWFHICTYIYAYMHAKFPSRFAFSFRGRPTTFLAWLVLRSLSISRSGCFSLFTFSFFLLRENLSVIYLVVLELGKLVLPYSSSSFFFERILMGANGRT